LNVVGDLVCATFVERRERELHFSRVPEAALARA
jgi:hypothetical protein